jgi:hypothetical protein
MVIFSVSACGKPGSMPTLPSDTTSDQMQQVAQSDIGFNTETEFGVFDIIIDSGKPSVSAVSKRHAAEIGESSEVEIDQYLSSDPCADCLLISNIGFDEDQRIVMDIGIRHPFETTSGRLDLDVFDVRAIFVVEGHTQFPQSTVGDDQLVGNFSFLENPDGFTTNFDDGPDGPYPGNLNPYIDFFTEDDPTWEGTGEEIPNHRMGVGAGYDFKRLLLNIEPGQIVQFSLVIGASYGQSAKRSVQTGDPGSRTNPTYYIPEFNRKEVYSVQANAGSIEFDGTTPKLIFDFDVLDWQAGAHVAQALDNPDDIVASSNVASVSLEIPELGYFSTTPDSITGLGVPEEPLNIRFSAPITRYSVFTYLASFQDERNGSVEGLDMCAYKYGYIDTFMKMGSNIPVADINTTSHEIVLGKKSVAVDEHRIYVVWCDVEDLKGKVYCSRSMDSGLTFEEPLLVNDTDHQDSKQRPSVAVDGEGIVYVVWEDYENLNPFSDCADIFLSSSNNYGYSFGQDSMVNDVEDQASDGQSEPSICAVGDGTVYVSWVEQGEGSSLKKINVAHSVNKGITFEETSASTEQLRTGTPSLAANESGTVWVAWRDYRNGQQDVFASRSTDGAQNFGPEIRINDDAGNKFQSDPALAINSDGTAYAAWIDTRDSGYNIYFARSTSGTTFSTNQKINRINGTALAPNIASTPNGCIYVTYRDMRNDSMGDIYITSSLNGGESFTTDHDVLVNDDPAPSIQQYPQVAVGSNGKVHLIWGDGRGLDPRIFYAQSIYP